MRVVTAAIAIPLVLGAIWLGGWAFYLFVALISTGALMEFYWLAQKKGALPNKLLGVLAGLVIVAMFTPEGKEWWAAHFVHLQMQNRVQFHDPMMLIAVLFVVIGLTIELFRGRGGALENLTATLAGPLYISLSLATLIGLRGLLIVNGFGGESSDASNPGTLGLGAEAVAHTNLYIVVAVIVTIWICDSGAYYCGRAFGRHKLFERVSPKKTWEGAIGGAVFAIAGMIGFRQWLLPFLSVGDAVVLGAVVGVFGQIGDLAESLLKRDAGVKDSSQLIPGHGGLLDRFDSLIFVAPLAYVYLVYARPLFH